MKKENTEQQKQIYSIRKNKAYGASSVLIGLMGSAFLLSGLAPTVQAEENDAKPETKPVDGSAVNGTNAPTVETEHLIIASQPKESNPKSESTPTDNPKTDVENASTNETKPLNSESTQPKEEPAALVNPTEGAKLAESGTTEAKPTEEKPAEETTTAKRSVSIVYKVRYVDRKSGKVVHEVTKTKTVETTEAKAKASITEIGAELANDSQLENYYVPDGNPTTMTKEIVEGADNVFVYEVEGFGEAETTKERTVALKYTVEYVDKKSGLVLASEEKEEKVSTTETVAKKEVTIQPSLTANEKLKDWVLSDGAPASQKLTLTEGTVGKVTFNLQNSEGGKVRNKRKVSTPEQDGKPYMTLENYTEGTTNLYSDGERITYSGRESSDPITLKYKIGVNSTDPSIMSKIDLTEGAKKLGFILDKKNGWMTATVSPTIKFEGSHEVGILYTDDPSWKVTGSVVFNFQKRPPHHGFELISDSDSSSPPVYQNDTSSSPYQPYGGAGRYGVKLRWDSDKYFSNYIAPIKWWGSINSSSVEKDITINNMTMPATPFGYFAEANHATVDDVTADTKRYYTMIPIYAPLDVSTNYEGNNKQGLSIKSFDVLEHSDGVEVELVDLRKDKAPEKGLYSNTIDFQTMPEYNPKTGELISSGNSLYGLLNTPYYLRFTKLPKLANTPYSVKFKIVDSLGLEKTFTLNFKTYENSIASSSSNSNNRGEITSSYALTIADVLFEPTEKYVDKTTGKVTVPISNDKQILGKVTLNKENAYIDKKTFPAGIDLEPINTDEHGNITEAWVVKSKGANISVGEIYSFSAIARDGHFKAGSTREFNFEVVDAINPIANQEWWQGSVPEPISVSMEHGSRITGIRVEASGGYAHFEGNLTIPNNPKISIYGLTQTPEPQKARVFVTYQDGNGKKHEVVTEFNYVIKHKAVDDLTISVTDSDQTISEGENWKDMVITTEPSEGVTIKVDKTKLPKGTRLVGNVIKGKGLYEGNYDVPILAVKGDIVKSTVVHLKVLPKKFVVSPETAEVEALTDDVKAVTTNESGEEIKTPVPRYGLQDIPDDAKVYYTGNEYSKKAGFTISSDGTRITGIPNAVGTYTFNASVSRTGPNGYSRFTTTTYTIRVTPKQFDFIRDQEHNTLVGKTMTPIPIPVPEGAEIKMGYLPEWLTYNKERNQLEGTPTSVGDYNIYVTANPKGVTGNDQEAKITIHVKGIPPEITITNNNRTVQIGTPMEAAIVQPSGHAKIFGSDPLMDSFGSGPGNAASEMGMEESRIAAFLKMFYGLNYDASTHTVSGTPTRTGTITFTFIARNDYSLGGGEARETFELNVVESLSKIPVITEAQEGSSAIKGSGVAGATVTVTLPDGAVKTAEVATDGTWTVETTTPLVKGQSISARQKEVNKTESNDISATVVGNSGLVPSKEALVDAIVEEATTITGKGENGSTITVTRPDGTVKTATVSEGTWSVTLDTAAVKGENILVTQTEPNKATSPAVTATVVPKITKGDQGKPGETGPKGEQGEPGTPGVPGKDGFTPEISVTPNDDGSYTITITQPNGKEPIRTTVKNGTNGTNGRDGRTPKVKLTPIYEDPAHPRTRRTRSVDEDREAQPTGKQIGVHITVYFDNNNNGTYDEGDELISEENIYDGVDGIDGRDGINGTNGTNGRDGANGATGETGAAGRDGRDGKDILNGTENPGENQGKDGDTFVNTKTGDIYVKENGTWKPAGNIKGPKGDDGKDILNGKIDPTSEIGKDGDKYVNTETGDIFVKENGTWKSAGNIKGPKGDKGENGTNGTDGRDGTNGTNGTDGVAGATGAAGHDGRDGKDGQSPTVTVRENTDGSHTIVITNQNGNTIETTVRDGKSPTVTVRENTDGTHTITIENADGKTTTTTVRDGKNGQSPTVSIRNNNDGTHTVTIINPDGSKTEAVIKDGKDGKDGQSPTVSVTNNGNGTHTIIITSSDGKVTTTVIKDGKCGCNDKPGGSTPGEPTRENSTTPNPGAPTPGGSTTPNPGAPTPGGSTTPNPGEPTPGGVPGMPEPPVHELPEFPGITPNPNPGAPTPGGTPDRNPGEPTPGGTPDRNPGAPTPGGTPDRNPGEPTPGTTPNQPVNPPEISITVNEHPNGELPKTGTTTDHLSILLGSGILLSLYVGKRKEEES